MTREEAKHIVDVVFDVPQAVRRAGEDRTYHEDEIREAKQMAIKALEQEPCEDAISRQAVLELIADYDLSMGQVVKGIHALPSVTPQEPRWVPVSEKLPEPFTFVNATCRSLVDDRENWVVETIYSPIPKEANKYGYSDWGNIPILNWGEAEVIAWVERIIPQPYKAEVEPQESENK